MIKSWLKRNFYRVYFYKKKVRFLNGVILNLKNQFEGLNVIGQGSEVVSSNVGLGSYIADNSVIRSTVIGRFCSIGSNVQTGLGLHPSRGFVSTHPAFFSTEEQAGFTFVTNNTFKDHKYVDKDEKHIVGIGNDVWIGNNVIIMDGVNIGDGAIIAAGAVVTKDVESFAIMGGVPAKLIKYRFTPEQIRALMDIKWWSWDYEEVEKNKVLFEDIEKFIGTVG